VRRAVNGLPAPKTVLPVSLTVTARLMPPAFSPRTDQPRKETVMKNSPVYLTSEGHLQTCPKLNERNKRFVFRALAAAEITSILVPFAREHGSVKIGRACAFRGDAKLELPGTKIFAWTIPIEGRPYRVKKSLPNAISSLCQDFLVEKHGQWTSDEGLGEFQFDVSARTVELEVDECFTHIDTSEYSF
jgi:Family of unknown function (DUF6878)